MCVYLALTDRVVLCWMGSQISLHAVSYTAISSSSSLSTEYRSSLFVIAADKPLTGDQ